MLRQKVKCIDIIQTIVTSGLLLAAIGTLGYGIYQYELYKSEKRPYVSLIRVDIESNLYKNYPILHPDLKKDVSSSEIIDADRKLQERVEEVIINLYYKNTGPLAAKDVQIFAKLIPGDSFTKDGKKNPNSIINDETKFLIVTKNRKVILNEKRLNY